MRKINDKMYIETMAWCLPTSKHSINGSWSIRISFVVCLNWEKFFSGFLCPLSFSLKMSVFYSPFFSFLFDELADLLVIMAHFPLS